MALNLQVCVCVLLPGELRGVDSCHKEELAALHKSISALDQEKDALQDEVDLKTERLVELQEELARKVAILHARTHTQKTLRNNTETLSTAI